MWNNCWVDCSLELDLNRYFERQLDFIIKIDTPGISHTLGLNSKTTYNWFEIHLKSNNKCLKKLDSNPMNEKSIDL